MEAANDLSICDARGCYETTAVDYEASRHHGTRLQPRVLMFPGDPEGRYHFCEEHHKYYKAFIADPALADG